MSQVDNILKRSPQKVITNDGSATLYSADFNQHYHNLSGALTESRHVFFEQNGICRALADHRDFTIFEIGFGTGFHMVLLEQYRFELQSRSRVSYFAVEKYPVMGQLIREMGFSDLFSGISETIEKTNRFSENLYHIREEETAFLDLPMTQLRVFRADFSDWDLNRIGRPADFIFHDAFSPKSNPELWTRRTFEKLLAISSRHGVLSTYCSATRARAAMALAGWHIARMKGPPGKREMTLASPDDSMLGSHKRVNEHRLKKRFNNEL
ncbi:MAG: tRNA (5-methylaminomethyl-2-thiouridine)(34)-methyltransferase MnmD [Balneolales bacterium]